MNIKVILIAISSVTLVTLVAIALLVAGVMQQRSQIASLQHKVTTVTEQRDACYTAAKDYQAATVSYAAALVDIGNSLSNLFDEAASSASTAALSVDGDKAHASVAAGVADGCK